MGGDQLGFAASLLDRRMLAGSRLVRALGVIDWSGIDALAQRLRAAGTGRRPYPPAAMLRALYLQAQYDLSDPELEEALLFRIDFRQFCGFALEAVTPDETTLCRFRNAAVGAGVLEAVFAEVNRQLSAKGLVLKKGTLVDATIVTAASRRPAARGSAARAPAEPEASFTRKGGRSYFGWRLHVGVDQGSGLVRSAELTPAHVNESLVAEQVICGDERAVYADRAYENKHRRARLRARGVKDRIMHRRHKHQAGLPRWQQVRNRLIARLRAPVEGVFGTLKRVFRRARSRYCGLSRTRADLLRVLTLYNLRRAARLCTP